MNNNGMFGYKSILVIVSMLAGVVLLIDHAARLKCSQVLSVLSDVQKIEQSK